jgi:hypothetical protein
VYVVVESGVTFILELVAPPGLHEYVAGPPAEVTVSVAEPPGQILSTFVLTFAVTVGITGIVIVVESLHNPEEE